MLSVLPGRTRMFFQPFPPPCCALTSRSLPEIFQAGNYPALAGNPNLEFASYPIYVIVNGQGNMPPLGPLMSDEQIVAVTEYIQTSFGNDYEPDATIEAVQTARPAEPNATTGEH